MILAFIIIAMLIGLVAIGNTEYKGTPKPATPRKTSVPVNAPAMGSTPQRSTSRQARPAKTGGYQDRKPARQPAAPSSNRNDFVELPEEAYAYHGLDLGGMPMYDNSVSDDRFLNDPDDGMSKDSSGFDEEF
uniref:Uncharacterized protein n=1 Tax=mine drainage metagenome TaxID=410659 RepID=E6QVU7_9ZZZZ